MPNIHALSYSLLRTMRERSLESSCGAPAYLCIHNLKPTERSFISPDFGYFPPDKIIIPPDGGIFPGDGGIFPPDEASFPADEAIFPADKAIFPTDKIILPGGKSIFPGGKIIFPGDKISFSGVAGRIWAKRKRSAVNIRLHVRFWDDCIPVGDRSDRADYYER